MAAISALEALKKPCVVDLTTDSQYVRQGITSWIHGWKRNGWRTADKKPVKNVELWQRLDAALKPHQVRWHWIKGHAGHAENERADQLAREGVAMARLKNGWEVAASSPLPLWDRVDRVAPHEVRRRVRGSLRKHRPMRETDPSSGSLRLPPSPTRGEGRSSAVRGYSAYSCPSSVSPPETSTLPGAGSRLSFLTTPSSTSIE